MPLPFPSTVWHLSGNTHSLVLPTIRYVGTSRDFVLNSLSRVETNTLHAEINFKIIENHMK